MYLESKLGVNDGHIRDIIRRQSLWARILLLLLVISANFRLYDLFAPLPLSNYLFNINIRFGGIIILAILIIWQKGLLAKSILARPEDGIKSDRRAIIQSLAAYFLMAAILGFSFQFLIPFRRIAGQLILWNYLWDFIAACFLTPLNEEVQYRFLALYVFDSFVGRFPATILSVLLFTLGHNYPLPGQIYIALVGLIAALLTIKYGKLWPAIFFHAFVNISYQFQQVSIYYHIYLPQ